MFAVWVNSSILEPRHPFYIILLCESTFFCVIAALLQFREHKMLKREAPVTPPPSGAVSCLLLSGECCSRRFSWEHVCLWSWQTGTCWFRHCEKEIQSARKLLSSSLAWIIHVPTHLAHHSGAVIISALTLVDGCVGVYSCQKRGRFHLLCTFRTIKATRAVFVERTWHSLHHDASPEIEGFCWQLHFNDKLICQ